MCTAITYQTKDFYFGRTLDYEHSFSEEVTITPRKFPLVFRHQDTHNDHYAIIGMACVGRDYPLYFDAVNERGLAMAGLNFVGNAHYHQPVAGMDNVASFEFIPWILSQCASVAEARKMLERVNITDTAFLDKVPPSQLHWMIADREEAVTVESMVDGLHIYENPVGVLTNNPSFDDQMFRLNDYMHLSSRSPENHFSEKLNLRHYSRGMGALGLPGDLSSQSRFVRAAFTKMNSVSGDSEGESVSQFFHVLDTVTQTRGCCEVAEGEYEMTIYTSCCNADKGIYYYTTYDNRQISALDMHRENLDGSTLIRYPLTHGEQIYIQN